MADFTAGMALMLKYQRMRLTLDELSQELGLAKNTLYNLISAGQCPVPTYAEGNRRFADVRDVGEFLDRQRNAAIKAFNAAQARHAA